MGARQFEVAMTLIRKIVSLFLTGLLAGSVSTAAQAQSCGRPANRPFRIFDATAYVGRPDWSRYGIEPIHIVDRGIWADGRRSGPTDPTLVRRYVESLPRDNAPIVLDFEQYELTGSDGAARTALVDLRGIAAAFRAAAPGRKIGFYGIVPIPDYARSLAGAGSAPYRAWQGHSNRMRTLQGNVDFLFPPAYTVDPDQRAWTAFATSQICEARRLSAKPVYVFLWPEYHEGSPLSGQYLDSAFWRLQLETAYRLADGVVIFGGYDIAANRPRNWNPQAPWYAPTLAFIRERLGRR
jgi:hypothetical protein